MVDVSREGSPIDRYVVLEYLSEGGMGAIYLGKKLGAGGFQKEVVLKQLLPEFTSQTEFIDLFLREARLSATLDHANIIHTIDLVTAGNEYFIVMEYLAGADLRTLVKKAKRRRNRFSAAAGIYIAREILSALAYAHAKAGTDGVPLRLIHRDVSPSNILVSHNGEVKLTDFGIAKAATHNSIFYRVKGKVGYMSPEQAKSEPMDHRSDLYSLAVCLYEVITGERLFVHAGLTSTADEIYSQPVPLLSRKVAGLPGDLDKVMLKALSIDPDARYQTAGEFQEALLRCAHKNGLMISAPELAQHLREVCGPVSRWREFEGRDGGGTAAIGGGGTEVYDAIVDGTEQIDLSGSSDDDDSGIEEVSDVEPSFSPGIELRRGRELSSMTMLGRLQGLELTSMIADEEDDDGEGAAPLVDLGDFGPPTQGPDDSQVPRPAPVRVDPSDLVPAVPARRPDVRPEAIEATEAIERLAPPRRSRLLPWALGGALLLAGGAIAAAIGLSGPELVPAPPQPAPEADPAVVPAPVEPAGALPPDAGVVDAGGAPDARKKRSK
jgi:serine/threonine protein kinase